MTMSKADSKIAASTSTDTGVNRPTDANQNAPDKHAPNKTVVSAKTAQNTMPDRFKSDDWVTLHRPPSDFSHHEARLLCEAAPGEWVSWVPGYGEIALQLSEFY